MLGLSSQHDVAETNKKKLPWLKPATQVAAVLGSLATLIAALQGCTDHAKENVSSGYSAPTAPVTLINNNVTASNGLMSVEATHSTTSQPSSTPLDQNSEELFTGRVIDAVTKLPIKNADVTLTSKKIPIHRTTDDNGVFVVPLKLLADGLIMEVNIEGYDPADITVTPSDRTEKIQLKPAKAPAVKSPITGALQNGGADTRKSRSMMLSKKQFKINSKNADTDTGINLKAGDQVKISPRDTTISVGPYVTQFFGRVSPKGVTGFVNTALANQGSDLTSSMPHGCLLYKIGDEDWKYAGDGIERTVSSGGKLKFNINDREQPNNEGNFFVDTTVKKSR